MINLLSHEAQRRNRAARLNLKLRGYVIILLLTLLTIIGLFGGGYYLSLQDRTAAETASAQNKEQATSYQNVKHEAEAFAANLKIAKAILSQETLYSDQITSIAQTLPSSAVLTALNLGDNASSTTAAKAQLQLNARVRTKEDAIVLKNTLEASPLFENVNINNVTEDENTNTDTSKENKISREFPVVVILSVTQTKPKAATP